MTYDPRAVTGIPTEPVGSLPRPSKLQAAYAAYDAGDITKGELEAEQEAAVQESIARMEATGSPIVSDGEQGILVRRKNSDELTKALARLINDPELARRMGGRGREMVERYRWAEVASQVEDYYEVCLRAVNGNTRTRAA